MRPIGMATVACLATIATVTGSASGQGIAWSRRAVVPAPAAIGQPAPTPRAPWLAQDPGDSLYRLARSELNAGKYVEAARHLRELRTRYPRSGYMASALYWEAYALSKTGSSSANRQALKLLDVRARRFPGDADTDDARDLATRIQAQLAQQGDPTAAAAIAVTAGQLAPPAPASMPDAPEPAPAPEAVAAVAQSARAAAEAAGAAAPALAAVGQANDGCGDASDDRLYALNALLQMNSEQAMPILKDVLARRDPGSVCLRRRAMFLVAQQHAADVEDVLLQSARSDPDPEVRGQAVFWLSQVNSPRASVALDSILRNSTDEDIQKKAIFALAQQHNDASTAALKAYIERPNAPEELRAQAVFWLGQRGDLGDVQYLKDLFKGSSSEALKERILFTVAQQSHETNGPWLLGVAGDPQEPSAIRKKALFWAAQMHAVDAKQLAGVYDHATDREMKEQVIFALSQSKDSAAVTELIHIAKTEPDHDLKRKALFWLGQSHDPRAAKVLMDVINQ